MSHMSPMTIVLCDSYIACQLYLLNWPYNTVYQVPKIPSCKRVEINTSIASVTFSSCSILGVERN